MHPTFDDLDADALAKREAQFNAQPGPRVGDWLDLPDGTPVRFTHDWDDAIQTTTPNFGLGSFYLDYGWASYSGALDPPVSKSKLVDTGEARPGAFWFFHHQQAKANNGVQFSIPCRVFKMRGE